MSATDHWNAAYASRREPRLNRFDRAAHNAALAWFDDVKGKRLLDLGCGMGAASIHFAQHGADVVAVDASDVAVSFVEQYCAERGIRNVQVVQCSAGDIGGLGRFDLVFGSMILHHIEPLKEFVDVLAGVLDGRAFFFENNAANRPLIWCRSLTGRFGIPKIGDREESPLAPAEVDLLRQRFDVTVSYPYLVLFRLFASYLLADRGWHALSRLDGFTYRHLPIARRYGYHQHLLLQRKAVALTAAEPSSSSSRRPRPSR